MDWIVLCTVAATAALSSIGIVVLWARMAKDPDQTIHAMLQKERSATIFLYDGTELVDCTDAGRRMFDELPSGGSDFQRLCRSLNARFAGIPSYSTLSEEGFHGEYPARAFDDPTCVRFDLWDGYIRIQFTNQSFDNDLGVDDVTLAAQAEELRTLRSVTNDSPYLMWQMTPNGDIDWANEAYLVEAGLHDETKPFNWPPRILFPGDAEDTETRRMSLDTAGGTKWYDVTRIQEDGRTVCFAAPADALVEAENSQRNFVQTLTKTFAHLSVGLVIFDRKRQLALFNPAALDLLTLPIEFLAQRPTLQRFLDKLREAQLIAEPKDYPSWRQQMTDLEARAENGTYCETWPLPGGLTFRVTGRPHPDGAIAFLFEDISAEMSITRRFHSEIALGRHALDLMDEAVAIFSENHALVLTNTAYRDLWGTDPDTQIAEHTISDAVGQWSGKFLTSDAPEALQDAIIHAAPGDSWRSSAQLADGRDLDLRVVPMANGAVLVGFRPSASLNTAAQMLAARRNAPAEADHVAA